MYKTAKQRANFLVCKYGKHLKGKILDIGSGTAYKGRSSYLKQAIKKNHPTPENISYYEVDISGAPDFVVDLEKEKLPFKNKSFDCTICTEVLEHLENPQEVFEELVRVTKKNIVISLPNCWAPLISKIVKNKENMVFYGLPAEVPKDRHKWFFNYSDAEKFIKKTAKKFNLEIIVCEPHFNYSTKTKKIIKKMICFFISKKQCNNLFSSNLWAVLRIK